MAQYSRATLTDAGVVIARRMMDDDSLHLTFTGIASGDGQYSTGEDLAAKTALKSQKQFFPLSSKKVTSDQVVQLKYVLSNINPDGTPLTVGYYVREVGIFAQVGSEAAVLYAIAVADENTADYLPEYNELQPSTITMDWFLTVANTENISIAASTTAYALASDLAETNDEVAMKLTAQGGDASGTIITTVTASTAEYPVPAAGDSMSTIVGKIVKFFGDIVKTFTGATSSAAGKKGLVPAPSAGQQTAYMRGDGQWTQPQNNATTTQNGYVLDAKMGKTLQDQITSLNDSLTNYITLINSFLIVDVYNALRIARQNFGTTMTFNVLKSANNCGIIVTGNPSENPSASVSLWAFIARPSSTTIYIYKIGGNNNVTLSAVCTSNGKITITASESCAMFAVYCGAIS